jgi:SAM-dependent methyltransferase
MSITLRSYAIAAATYIPGLEKLSGRRTGGTISARYCYSVWLRHLSFLHRNRLPWRCGTIAELGPGDSLGIGLAALLSGAERYLALDAVRYADTERNLRIFEELVTLFRNRAPIPDEAEFPLVQPPLGSYSFPADILTPDLLDVALDAGRLDAIRASIAHASDCRQDSDAVAYLAPWQPSMIASGTVDLVISQSVLEYPNELSQTYREIARWLKPGGVMSHEVDFKSMGVTEEWNGHWACPDPLWHLATARRRNRINREPCSTHIALTEAVGCRMVGVERTTRGSDIDRKQLTARFRNLTDDDLTTSSALLQSVKSACRG